MLSRDEYLAAWSRWHGGVDPGRNALVGRWLTLVYAAARPLAGVPPLLVTVAGLGAAAAAVLPAAGGGFWLLLAAGLVFSTGFLDSLDGALAIGTGRASRRGFVLDSAVDRLTEAAYATALWLAGAPGWLAAAFGALCWLPDYLRARAGQAGVGETGALSVWERPTRVLLTGFTLAGAAVVSAVVDQGLVVTVGVAVGAVLGLAGTVQVGLALRRTLGDGPGVRRR